MVSLSEDMFLRVKPVNLLLAIKKTPELYLHSISKTGSPTYSHLQKVSNKMLVEGLVTFEKRGRVKLLTLTAKGLKLASLFEQAISIMK